MALCFVILHSADIYSSSPQRTKSFLADDYPNLHISLYIAYKYPKIDENINAINLNCSQNQVTVEVYRMYFNI